MKPAALGLALGVLFVPVADAQVLGEPEFTEWFDAALLLLAAETRSAGEAALRRLPETEATRNALGLSALLGGHWNKARLQLPEEGPLAIYRAQAEVRTPGKTMVARSLVVRLSQTESATGQFFAALAFEDAGQHQKADALLQKAVKSAGSALDEAFAPDPAVGLGRVILEEAKRRGRLGPPVELALAEKLLLAGRRGEALRIAEKIEAEGALRILVAVMPESEARRALDAVDRVLSLSAHAEDARVARLELYLRLGETRRARAELESMSEPKDPDLRGVWARARARLAETDSSAATRLDFAEAALRAEPNSNPAVALQVRALLAAGEVARAASFAVALLERKPWDVDPFDLLAEVRTAKGQRLEARDERLRSQAFQREQQKLERAVKRREKVLWAVRDGESGVGIAGLSALRQEQPDLALPLDLALARSPKAGTAVAARERILARCAPRWKQLLGQTDGSDQIELELALYGPAEKVRAPLSGADPQRCGSGRDDAVVTPVR